MIFPLFFLFGCKSDPKPDPRVALLNSLGKKIIVPTYKEFEDQSKELHVQSQAFCSEGTLDIEQLKISWWNSRVPWKQMELVKFGPYKEEPYRLGPKIDFWPIRPDNVDDLLYSDTPLEIDAFSNFGTTVKGLPAIEYLLYKILPENTDNDRVCEYVQVSTEDLYMNAMRMRKAWDPSEDNYLENLTSPSEQYEMTEEALAEVVNRLGHTIENIRVDKLAKPLENAGNDSTNDKIESPYSHRSIQDIKDNLEGIRLIYYGSEDGLGIDDCLKDRGYDLDEEFQSLYDDCMTILDTLDSRGPLTDIMVIDPEIIQYLDERLAGLQQFIQADVIGALSLWLTFNDADGD